MSIECGVEQSGRIAQRLLLDVGRVEAHFVRTQLQRHRLAVIRLGRTGRGKRIAECV